ncbi:protein amalgam-like [Sitophilus oryzae]|uniref:Protein amalgam-like n=1 Tax=Sitophilus oryzae TaxID=7048 RepID=A0A6J2Y8M8_SITOR|nr:protein amalgam-like [Sitophilus oryzae]XP_030760197.1 protein amalgam-like [Sitophilus oryzae]XP_030760198.1 protein amalgam-like [Sitophilus oryzae]
MKRFLSSFIVCLLVLFGVTGELWTKKEDRFYDFANFPKSRQGRSYVARGKNYGSANSLTRFSEQDGMFITQNFSTVIAQMGGTAKLPCIIRKFNNIVVSWIRKNDSPPTILTVGLGTYIADERFLVEHARHLQNWGLVIKHVQISDAGLYECQVSTHPTTSIFIELKVTEAVAEISGAPDLHIRAGSRLRIVCRLRHSTEPPSYVFWYHDHRMINHDVGVVVTADRSTSILLVEDVDPTFSGNYTCYPSNATPAYVNVHVLNSTEEENPAAMMHNNTNHHVACYFLLLVFLFLHVLCFAS